MTSSIKLCTHWDRIINVDLEVRAHCLGNVFKYENFISRMRAIHYSIYNNEKERFE